MAVDNEILLGLMKKAASGNDAAFEKLVKHFEKPVYNLAMQTVRNREDALDVAQDVFLKLWRTRGSFRGDCSVSTWVMRIAKNTVLDLLRRRTAHASESLTYEDGEGESAERDIPDCDTASDPAASYERKERIAEVRRSMLMLSEEHREIIVLRDMEGFSYSEISAMLGIEEGTVKSRLSRARNSLKEILEKRNIFG